MPQPGSVDLTKITSPSEKQNTSRTNDKTLPQVSEEASDTYSMKGYNR